MIRRIQSNDQLPLEQMLSMLFDEIEGGQQDLFHTDIASRIVNFYLKQELNRSLALLSIEDVSQTFSAFFLARIEERPLRKDHRILYIDAAYTLPDFRKKGLMEGFLIHAIDWCKYRNINVIELRTPGRNETGRMYWEGRGFFQETLQYTARLSDIKIEKRPTD